MTAAKPQGTEKRRPTASELRHAPGGHRIVGVQLLEVEAGAAAFLLRHAVAAEMIELLRHVAEAGPVEPEADQAPLPLRLGEVLELSARVHQRVVVEHQHLAALEEEAQAMLGRLGDLVEEVERRDILVRKGNAELLVPADDAGALIATAQLAVPDGKDRNPVRRGRLVV